MIGRGDWVDRAALEIVEADIDHGTLDQTEISEIIRRHMESVDDIPVTVAGDDLWIPEL